MNSVPLLLRPALLGSMYGHTKAKAGRLAVTSHHDETKQHTHHNHEARLVWTRCSTNY